MSIDIVRCLFFANETITVEAQRINVEEAKINVEGMLMNVEAS